MNNLNKILASSLMIIATTNSLFAANFPSEVRTSIEKYNVTNVKKIEYTVNERQLVQVCEDKIIPIVSSNSSENNYIPAILGGAIGGVLGNQIGGGKGKIAATIGGAVLGTMAGNKVASNQENNQINEYSSKTEQVCHQEEKIIPVKKTKYRSEGIYEHYINGKIKRDVIYVETDNKPAKEIIVKKEVVERIQSIEPGM